MGLGLRLGLGLGLGQRTKQLRRESDAAAPPLVEQEALGMLVARPAGALASEVRRK